MEYHMGQLRIQLWHPIQSWVLVRLAFVISFICSSNTVINKYPSIDKIVIGKTIRMLFIIHLEGI